MNIGSSKSSKRGGEDNFLEGFGRGFLVDKRKKVRSVESEKSTSSSSVSGASVGGGFLEGFKGGFLLGKEVEAREVKVEGNESDGESSESGGLAALDRSDWAAVLAYYGEIDGQCSCCEHEEEERIFLDPLEFTVSIKKKGLEGVLRLNEAELKAIRETPGESEPSGIKDAENKTTFVLEDSESDLDQKYGYISFMIEMGYASREVWNAERLVKMGGGRMKDYLLLGQCQAAKMEELDKPDDESDSSSTSDDNSDSSDEGIGVKSWAKEAEASYRKALELGTTEEDWVTAIHCLANLVVRKRPEEALDLYEDMLRLDAWYIVAMFGKANALTCLGRGQEAIELLNKMKADFPMPENSDLKMHEDMKPLWETCHIQLWRAHESCGNEKEVLESLGKLIELRTLNFDVYLAYPAYVARSGAGYKKFKTCMEDLYASLFCELDALYAVDGEKAARFRILMRQSAVQYSRIVGFERATKEGVPRW